MLHQTGGFQGHQFNGVVGIYFRLSLFPWQRNYGNFNIKLDIARPIQDIEPWMLHQAGVFEVNQFTGVTEIYINENREF